MIQENPEGSQITIFGHPPREQVAEALAGVTRAFSRIKTEEGNTAKKQEPQRRSFSLDDLGKKAYERIFGHE